MKIFILTFGAITSVLFAVTTFGQIPSDKAVGSCNYSPVFSPSSEQIDSTTTSDVQPKNTTKGKKENINRKVSSSYNSENQSLNSQNDIMHTHSAIDESSDDSSVNGNTKNSTNSVNSENSSNSGKDALYKRVSERYSTNSSDRSNNNETDKLCNCSTNDSIENAVVRDEGYNSEEIYTSTDNRAPYLSDFCEDNIVWD